MSKGRRKGDGRRNKLPKGAYRLPTGGYVHKAVGGKPDKRGRRIVVIPVWREEPDLERFAKALIEVALRQQAKERQTKKRKKAS